MADDYILENAPLVEVVAEYRWQLQRLSAIPNGAVDVNFQLLRDRFTRAAAEQGFSHVENLAPDGVPLELLPYRPVVRFRQAPNRWPLFQLGPGLLAVNIVPPYRGWPVFREYISQGLRMLQENHPLREIGLATARLELRKINGFTKRHGYRSYASFMRDNIALDWELPKGLLAKNVDSSEEVTFSPEIRFSLISPERALGIMKIAPGSVGAQHALLLQFQVQSREGEPATNNRGSLLEWMDAAQSTIRHWFETIQTKKLKDAIGPEKPIEEA